MPKDVFVTTRTIEGPEAGTWYEKGHHEITYIEPLAAKRGVNPYHVLLTRKEWNELQKKIEALDDEILDYEGLSEL